MKCDGNSNDHCCYVNGKVCNFLIEREGTDRRWNCGLLEKYGSWDIVYNSIEYISELQPAWDSIVKHYQNSGRENYATRCGDWPAVGEKCAVCGKIG